MDLLPQYARVAFCITISRRIESMFKVGNTASFAVSIGVRALACIVAGSVVLGGVAAASPKPNAHAQAGLPSSTSDAATVRFGAHVSLESKQVWLSQIIVIRQEALADEQVKIGAAKRLSSPDRSMLTSLQQASTAQLSTITLHALTANSNPAIVTQANAVLGLQILSTVIPQLQLEMKIDALIAQVIQLSRKESAVAAAIAITLQNQSRIQAEQGLDASIKACVTSLLAGLRAQQHSLTSISTTDPVAASATLSAATAATVVATHRLHRAYANLNSLVGEIAGKN